MSIPIDSPQSSTSSVQSPTSAPGRNQPPEAFPIEVILSQFDTYAETIEKAADRRGTVNRFYVAIHTGLISALAIVGGYGLFNINVGAKTVSNLPLGGLLVQIQTPTVITITIVGIILSVAWFVSILSFRVLQSAKFEVIKEIEVYLPFRMFKREGDIIANKRRVAASTVELGLPVVSFILYCTMLIIYASATFSWPFVFPHT